MVPWWYAYRRMLLNLSLGSLGEIYFKSSTIKKNILIKLHIPQIIPLERLYLLTVTKASSVITAYNLHMVQLWVGNFNELYISQIS